MTNPIPFTINIRGELLDLSRPVVMGVLNVTPDSFLAESRAQEDAAIVERVAKMLEEGASIIDIGACSTRPGSTPVEAEEEMRRIRKALPLIRKEFPEAVLSIDTFRADIAACAVEELGADIINDVSGGLADLQMFPTVARLNVPYVLTHSLTIGEEEPQSPNSGNWVEGKWVNNVLNDKCTTINKNNPITSNLKPNPQNLKLDPTAEVLRWLGAQSDRLHGMGVKDVIIDPGYGFGKTTKQSFQLLSMQHVLQVLGLPILAGLSRKRMVWQTLGTTPEAALNGTTVLNTLALTQGANILRVHDVREAVEAIRLMEAMNET